uniref:Uncharacterized protein n=1 Tax=Panagrolaimus sp. ES5 TaxID=591445 RepID=A0AC34FPR8_9BILA
MELNNENDIPGDNDIEGDGEDTNEKIADGINDSSEKNSSKLFTGLPHSYDDYVQSFMLFCRSANINDAVADKFLHFSKYFMPANNKCPGDIRTVKSHFEKLLPATNELKEIHFCKTCESLLENCQCSKSQAKAFGRLQLFSIKPQIKMLMEKYKDALSAYRDRLSQCENGVYMDSLNGSARKRIIENIISLAMYTDGLKIASASNKELWILGFTLLDLPMKIRFAQSNFIHFAMWYSDTKPPWQIFSKDMNKQLNDGIKTENIFYAFKVLQVNADMPARAILLNCKQCGYTPCLRCDVVGEKIGTQIHFSNREIQTTTRSSYYQLLNKSLSSEQKKTNEHISVKGKSPFDQILRIPECITGDIMHSGYYGPLKNDFVEILKIKLVKTAFDDTIKR